MSNIIELRSVGVSWHAALYCRALEPIAADVHLSSSSSSSFLFFSYRVRVGYPVRTCSDTSLHSLCRDYRGIWIMWFR